MTGAATISHHARCMADRPTLNDLRALGAGLPPSERIQASEAADVVSALAAVAVCGDEILAASKEGGNAVYQYYHDQISDNRPDGADEPVKGQQLTEPAAASVTPAAPAAQQEIDYDKLAAAIVKAQQTQETTNQPHQGDTPSQDVTPPTQAAPAQDNVTSSSSETGA